jgi:GDP/UDP-N,N'-diacetylbacillosamine 2-epimerase (hydrolysing)
MKIGVLTSSRADYGIYLPLLNEIKKDHFFDLELIAFGTHLSSKHGFTLDDIEKDGYDTIHQITSLVDDDGEKGIAISYGNTVLKFSEFWQDHSFDLVFCLGDRFEMSGAVQAGIPFGVKFAHIHGGETTLGAIDNIYRHQITLASILHFTATQEFTKKVIKLTGISDNVHTVGSLSLDGIENYIPIKKHIFLDKFKIPNQEFALITFHPETIKPNLNKVSAVEMRNALAQLSKKIFLVITMPNADTLGSVLRFEIKKLKNDFPGKVVCIENFGKENYFSAMFFAKVLIGNTSSGIIEAASFNKYVVNVGDRQKGRLQSKNCIDTPFIDIEIINAVNKALSLNEYKGNNIYCKAETTKIIINKLKLFNEVE